MYDSIYTPLLQHFATSIRCTENAIGDLDVFYNDTLITEVNNPFECGGHLTINRDYFQFPEPFSIPSTCYPVSAFDQFNNVISVDSVEERSFYQDLRAIFCKFQRSLNLEADFVPPYNRILYRHIYSYDVGNDKLSSLCSCSASLSSEIEDRISSLCRSFCKDKSCGRISFLSFSLHEAPSSDFHKTLRENFPQLKLPLLFAHGRIQSQKSFSLYSYLDRDILSEYFSSIDECSKVRKEFHAIGFIPYHDFFVVLIRRILYDDIAMLTMDRDGKLISSVYLENAKGENNFMLIDDGHLFFLDHSYPYSCTIGPNGKISYYNCDVRISH